MVPLVDVRGVVKVFEAEHPPVLAGVDLQVAAGELVAITGPSGSGKSTLLHLLAALDRPTRGSVHIDGVDLRHRHDLNRYRRAEIGIVFQLHNLIPRLTAIENVEIAMFSTHRKVRARRDRARVLLEALALPTAADRTPPKLSGGERQRVAIARALANEPRIVLADEPTGSLDRGSAAIVLSLFEELRRERGTTFIIITHDQSVAAIADRQYTVRAGHLEVLEDNHAPHRDSATANLVAHDPDDFGTLGVG